jgi:hypothetical protein
MQEEEPVNVKPKRKLSLGLGRSKSTSNKLSSNDGDESSSYNDFLNDDVPKDKPKRSMPRRSTGDLSTQRTNSMSHITSKQRTGTRMDPSTVGDESKDGDESSYNDVLNDDVSKQKPKRSLTQRARSMSHVTKKERTGTKPSTVGDESSQERSTLRAARPTPIRTLSAPGPLRDRDYLRDGDSKHERDYLRDRTPSGSTSDHMPRNSYLERAKDQLSSSEHKPRRSYLKKKPKDRKKGSNFIKNRISSVIGAEDAMAMLMLREFNEMDI